MYFKRLEMHGFKSFAEPAVIEFHEGVTCIVGPNGSGKSNISDAIRWVLGEQSPKMLRGGKMEEVIFSGTASRKSRGMAEVTLVIDNTAGILPIDYNEVAITRRMYRSGESEYLINNNQCRLRDVRELIMDTGIGVDGYSIIGQGKISEIVSSKPESRREIFEEAAGVVMYKSKKAESERKLDSARANLERVNDIIGEIESRIDGLRDDSVKAEEYLKLKERFKELEINITLKNIEKLEDVSQTVREDISRLGAEIEKLSQEKRILDEKTAQSRQKNENLEQLSNEARDKLVAGIEEISALTNKSQMKAERLSSLERDAERVEGEIQELRQKRDREAENAERLSDQGKEIEDRLSAAEEDLKEKIENAAAINSKLSEILAGIDDNRNKMYELYNMGSSKNSEAKSMESYRASLMKRKEQIGQESKKLSEDRKTWEEEIRTQEEKSGRIRENLSDLKKAAEENRKKFLRLTEEKNKIEKELSHINIKMSQLNARKNTIEEMENNYEGYNGAVRFVMKSGLRGIEGVAAELMEVPGGFEVAIETAMGASMQNIICQKDSDAKEAIKALKDNRAGRLTFLPMASIRGNKAALPPSVTSSEGYIGLACDIVKYSDKYDGVFKYLLGRVAIVRTMQDAIDLSKKAGLRFVTVEGEIVNGQGAITGGKYKNATANLLERKSEIGRLTDQIREISQKSNVLERERGALESNISAAREEKEELEAREKSLQMESFDTDAQLKTLKAGFIEMSGSDQRYTQQLLSIDIDLREAQETAQRLTAEAEECQKAGEDAAAEITKLMEEHDTLKETADKAADDITATRIEKNKHDSDKENLMKLLNRVKDSMSDIEQQIEAKSLMLNQFSEEKKSILLGSEDVEERVKAKTQEKLMLEEYIARVTEERGRLSAEIEEMAENQAKAAETLNSYQDQKYSQEIRAAKNETQLDTLKEKLWEDFEISYLQAIEFKKEDFAMSPAQRESREIRNRLRELGDVNVGAIAEYAQVSERYQFLIEQRSDITGAMDQLKAIVDDMERTIKIRFKDNFDKVVINFEEIFRQLFGGGHAELRLDNEEDPLEAGIEIVAQPPGKKLQNINLMSGGEKTMTAIALMFAVLKTRPTPFCILDEVEAALDDNNIDRFSKYLRNFHDIQFAIVTHQKATMEHADVLYGVTMPEHGISKVLSLRLGDDFDL